MKLLLYSGKQLDPMDPRTCDIDIVDIAHALSQLCRFAGHTKHFYSVAQHSINLSFVVEPKHAPWALLHDAAEAYMGDLPRPVKVECPHFVTMEERLLRCIARKFELPLQMPSAVKRMDTALMHKEASVLMPHAPWMDPAQIKLVEMSNQLPWALTADYDMPHRIESQFIERFRELYHD